MSEVRLIDANALKNSFDSAYTTFGQCVYAKGIVDRQPTIPDIDRAAMLRLCNEIEDIAQNIKARTMSDSYFQAQCIIDKAKEIGRELTEDAGKVN